MSIRESEGVLCFFPDEGEDMAVSRRIGNNFLLPLEDRAKEAGSCLSDCPNEVVVTITGDWTEMVYSE